MLTFTDLHLHSCLSPCARDEMTPWNIVGMASLKELDVIAITDHNTALNLPCAMEAGQALGVQIIPGIEVASKEEVHILAYFDTLEQALAFGEVIYEHLPKVKNEPDLFGRQIIIRGEDEESGELEKLLISATDFSIEKLCDLIGEYGGISVPAHINRGNNGMIGALGLMPFFPNHPLVEVSLQVSCPDYATKGRFVLHSSDAHQLSDIQERVFSLETDEKTARGVMARLRAEIFGRR